MINGAGWGENSCIYISSVASLIGNLAPAGSPVRAAHIVWRGVSHPDNLTW